MRSSRASLRITQSATWGEAEVGGRLISRWTGSNAPAKRSSITRSPTTRVTSLVTVSSATSISPRTKFARSAKDPSARK